MLFVVTGAGPNGLVRHEHNGAKAAIEDALELMGQGMSYVRLADPKGRIYKSTEFHLLLNERGKFDA